MKIGNKHSLGKWDNVIDWIIGIGFVFGFILLIKTSIDINNFVIPNTGLTLKEAMKCARQTVKPELWTGIVLVGVGYLYVILFKKI